MNNQEFKSVGYIPNWGDFTGNVKALNFDKITDLIIAFVNPINENADLEPTNGLAEVVKMAHSNNTRVSISLGGAIINEELWAFLQQEKQRPVFIQKVVNFVQEFNLDGVDIDLEGPSIGENYAGFVKDLSIALHNINKEVSAALAFWTGASISDEALACFDFINMMAYDETGIWTPDKPGQHSSFEKAEKDINYWHNERNVPLHKLILGLPFYGYSFNDYTSPTTSLNYTYEEILENYPNAADQDELQMAEKHVVYYNGKPTIRKKTQLAIDQKLAGIMVWQLVFDAFGENSLLNAAYEIIDKENVIPSKKNPAIYKDRWVYALIQKQDDLTDTLENNIIPFVATSLLTKQINDWMYTINEKKEILLFLKTNAFFAETAIKPALENLFREQLLEYKGYHLLNFAFTNTANFNTKLFTHTSNLFRESILEEESWTADNTMNLAIPLQLILVHTIENDLVSVMTFFQKLVNDTIQTIAHTQENPAEWSENFIQQLENNFEQQKEGFVGFCNYIFSQIEAENFEDDTYTDWHAVCKNVGADIYKMQQDGKLVTPEGFTPNFESSFSVEQQNRWGLLEQYIRFMDGQLNLDPLTACSVHYAIGQSLPLLNLAVHA